MLLLASYTEFSFSADPTEICLTKVACSSNRFCRTFLRCSASIFKEKQRNNTELQCWHHHTEKYTNALCMWRIKCSSVNKTSNLKTTVHEGLSVSNLLWCDSQRLLPTLFFVSYLILTTACFASLKHKRNSARRVKSVKALPKHLPYNNTTPKLDWSAVMVNIFTSRRKISLNLSYDR